MGVWGVALSRSRGAPGRGLGGKAQGHAVGVDPRATRAFGRRTPWSSAVIKL